MAEIPIEKKSGFPGWLWPLLAALLAALLLWWLLSGDDEEEVVATQDTVAVAPVETASPIGAGAAAAGAGAAAGAAAAYTVGQNVSLDNARVTSLVGDMAFNAEANGQNMLVLFNEVRTPGTATEGQIDVNPGMVVNIDGQIRSSSDPLPAGVTADQMGGATQYLYANEIEVVSRAQG